MLAFWIELFCRVILLKYPAVPEVVASEIIMADEVFIPLMMMQFLTPSFCAGADTEPPIHNVFGEVVEVFRIVRFLSVPPLLLPSKVMYFEVFSFIKAPFATEPLIVEVTPVNGLNVMVFVAEAPVMALMMIGKVSEVLYVTSFN